LSKVRGLAVAVLLVAAASCAQQPEQAADEDTGGSANERIVTVDHQYEGLGSYNWRFFPRSMKAHPGQTLVFRRQFTGEQHSVVFGTIPTEVVDKVERIDFKYAKVGDDATRAELDEVENQVTDVIKPLPPFAEYPNVAQSAAQPCYLDKGPLPRDVDTPCTREQQRQPEFNGKQAYYSSGLIPTSGPDANEYRVPLADDIKPGNYRYYCAVHFPYMQGKIQVMPGDGELPDAREVERTWKGSLTALENPLRDALAAARKDQATLHDIKLSSPFAGVYAHPEFSVAVAEFVPKTITARVGEAVTWTVLWGHTITFNAPRELPAAFITDEDGTVRRNPEVDQATGGAPPVEPLNFDQPRLIAHQTRFPEIRRIDGGTWDGEGYFSSGLIGSEPYAKYTLRVAKAGRYSFRCLIHPRMRGTLVVNE
jgi:plastocyanin